MQKHLFLTGPSGVGKSTLLLRSLGPFLPCAGGFFTQRLRNERGETLGFRMVAASEAKESDGPYDPRLPGIFMDFAKGQVQKEDAFARAADRFLQGAESRSFLLLDEIGGFEMALPVFTKRLRALLMGPVPCIGVWKYGPLQEIAASRRQDPAAFLALCRVFEREVTPYVRFLPMHKRDCPEAAGAVADFVQSLGRPVQV